MREKTSYEEDMQLIEKLIANWEDETVEFKEAGKDFKTDEIGKYVSALSNEANLAGIDSAWLVFGVRNKTREVVGTDYRTDPKPCLRREEPSPSAMACAYPLRRLTRDPTRSSLRTWASCRNAASQGPRSCSWASPSQPSCSTLIPPRLHGVSRGGEERAYEHFTIPFVLSTTRLYAKIRNYKLHLLAPGELIQREVEKNEQGTVLEAIHNCLAHQDYSQHSRIAVYEYADRLEFVSQGSFFEGEPDEYAIDPHMPRRYRNTTLVMAMTELGMINHLGYGIESMNRSQARRYLPLPEYDLTNPSEVRLTIWGSVVDEAYTQMLMSHTDLPFEEVMALDRVQKGRPIGEDLAKRLKRKGLVEGRRPRLRVAAPVADATGTKVDYLEKRGQTDEWLMALIHDRIKKSGPLFKAEIVDLIRPHMPSDSTDKQCANKVDNLMRKMKLEYGAESIALNGRRVWNLT